MRNIPILIPNELLDSLSKKDIETLDKILSVSINSNRGTIPYLYVEGYDALDGGIHFIGNAIETSTLKSVRNSLVIESLSKEVSNLRLENEKNKELERSINTIKGYFNKEKK